MSITKPIDMKEVRGIHDSYFENEPDFEALAEHLKTYSAYMLECTEECATEAEFNDIIELVKSAQHILWDIRSKFDV